MSKTFCILPWIHVQNKPDGTMKPCCRFDVKHDEYKTAAGYKFDKFNIKTTSFTEAINSEEWNEIRNSILAGERVPGCRKCYQEEDFQYTLLPALQVRNSKQKIKSMRVKENWLWNEGNQEELLDNSGIKLRYLELSFGNYCNLKCRTCNGHLSTTWYDDENILSDHYEDRKFHEDVVNVDNHWKLEDFMYAEEIKFTGGEPMLHPDFIKTIDMIISTGRQHLITLDIFTNASWIPRDKVLDRLKQFKKVRINLSVDGIGTVNEYIRYPSEWAIVEESVKEWLLTEKNNPDVFLIYWAPIISVLNVWHFHKMIDWWLNLQSTYKGQKWWQNKSIRHSHIINIVHDPKYLKPSLYPKKLLLIEKLINHREGIIQEMKNQEPNTEIQWAGELHIVNMYNKVIGALHEETDMEQLKLLVEYTADLDKIRGQDVRTQLIHLWKRIDGMIEYKGRISE